MKTVLQSLKHHSEYPRQNDIALKNFSEKCLENVMLSSNIFKLKDIHFLHFLLKYSLDSTQKYILILHDNPLHIDTVWINIMF